jgi:cell division protein ZapA (FtsZ GTPase activity inhibitor)
MAAKLNINPVAMMSSLITSTIMVTIVGSILVTEEREETEERNRGETEEREERQRREKREKKSLRNHS